MRRSTSAPSFSNDVDDQGRSGAWDIGADEFGAVACCALSVSGDSSAVTVTAPEQFEMVFTTAAGGSIEQLYDLVEDPGRTLDLAGGLAASTSARGLHNFGLRVGAPFYNTGENDTGSQIHVLEATPVRVRLRQEAFYQDNAGGPLLGGVKGYGDYSVYGVGRIGLHWDRWVTAPGGITYGSEYKEMFLHYLGSGPLSLWTRFHDGGSTFPGSGQSDFVMGQNESSGSPGAYTDVLEILSEDWTTANGHFNNANSTNTGVPAEERVNIYWQETDGETNGMTLPAGRHDTWDSLTYLKPTTLADQADAAVTGRSTDYRSPATPGIMVGTPWQDPDEYTGSDNFNEAEAAYLFTMDVANGLRFDLDGAATPRFQPFFKIRQWRSVDPPPTITFDEDSGGPAPAVTLIRDADYRSDVKPVSRAPFADDLLWHSTLESEAAVTSPDVGTGGTVPTWSGAPYDGAKATPATGKYGQGYLFDAGGEQVVMTSSGDVDYRYGAVELWFKPNWNHDDGVEHRLWTYQVDIDHQLFLRKRLTNNLQLMILDGPVDFTSTSVNPVNYSWRAGDWVHLRVTWDKDAASGLQSRIFINGIEVNHFHTGIDYNPAPGDWPDGGTFRLGVDTNGDSPADGVIDEVRVYSSPTAPGPGEADPSGAAGLAQGGLASDPSEYLSQSTRNFTYGFNPVDGATTRRGEYAYFGSDSKFRGLNVTLATAGTSGGTLDLQWQYWNGTTWTSLVLSDETAGLTRNGSLSWAGDPFGWSPYSVNGGPDLYYVRAHLSDSSASYSTAPTESKITTDVLLFQYCSDVTTDNEEFSFTAAVPTPVTLTAFEARPQDSAVSLAWQTGSELSNLGFHLHRSLSETGPWTRLTSTLIPGLGSSAVGTSYSWTDTGLQNGTRYFYRLEDVDTASVSTFHGPVSAVPQAAPGGGEEEGSRRASRTAAGHRHVSRRGSPTPGEPPPPGEGETPPANEPEPVCSDDGRCLYGDPGEPTLRVLSRSPLEMTVELSTPGFVASPDPAGVSVDVTGFVSPNEAQAVDLPFKRAVLDAVVGRRARLVSVEASDELSWATLRPAAVAAPAVDSRPDGTVRAVRTRIPLTSSALGVPRARLAGSAFMGHTKKLALELHPLRWDPAQGRLVLSKTLRVTHRLRRGRRAGDRGRLHRKTQSQGPEHGPRGLRPSPRHLPRAPRGRLRGRLPPGGTAPASLRPPSRPGRAGRPRPRGADHRHLRAGERSLLPGGPGGRLHRLLLRALLRPRAHVRGRGDGTGLRRAPHRALGIRPSRPRPLRDQPHLPVRAAPGPRPVAVGVCPERDDEERGSRPRRGRSRLGPLRTGAGLPPGGIGRRGVGGAPPELRPQRGVSRGDQLRGDGALRLRGHHSRVGPRRGDEHPPLTNVGDTGVVSRVFLDRVEVEYPETSGILAGRFGGAWTEEGVAQVALAAGAGDRRGLVTGFSSLFALDVTDPASPLWLSGLEPGPGSVRMQVEPGRRYQVITPDGLLVPRVSHPVETGLRDTRNQADYVLVAPRAFMDAAQPLLLRRESQGLATHAASLEDIAQDFGGGAPSAEAIRDFLAFAFHSWQQPSPRYVLLLGDASFDPRNFTGFDQGAPLPALWAKTSYLWTASDPAIAAVNGEDLLPDLALGRLPATNLAQAHALVQKVLDWEDAGYDLSAGRRLSSPTIPTSPGTSRPTSPTSDRASSLPETPRASSSARSEGPPGPPSSTR